MHKYTLLILFVSILIFSCGSKKTSQKSPDGKFPEISDDSLLTLVQYRTFQYFWDGAEPNSGMAPERINVNDVYEENDKSVVTTGGTGFGVMAILVGIERKFITREEGVDRLTKIVDFLEKADRFHGAWSHWIYGETGKVKPFGQKDNGADLVETSFLFQGLLAVRQYFSEGNDKERALAQKIDKLWREIDFKWFTQNKDVIYWHWSPEYGWEMNFPVTGYNECLIMYVLAASSPTHPVQPAAYHKGWARNGDITDTLTQYGHLLELEHNGAPEFGGPLFWAHYSFLGLNPKGLKDKYADYWRHNVNHSLINYEWCKSNPLNYKGYSDSCWGLTASYSIKFYAAHAPGKQHDLGVISPTAALSSFPYTPKQSMKAIKYFYYTLGDKIFGKYGFYDAFSIQDNWYPQKYLAIDQGPAVVMMENYRSGLLWKLFMSSPDIQDGLTKLGFEFQKPK